MQDFERTPEAGMSKARSGIDDIFLREERSEHARKCRDQPFDRLAGSATLASDKVAIVWFPKLEGILVR
jgi:hypothetical protein